MDPADPTPAVTVTRDGPVVVLVHGTFARNAPWTNPGGQLYDRLVQRGCQVSRFQWSGQNSHYARRLAANDLTRDLEELRKRNPGAPLWVIAHSHGGNIAVQAGQKIWTQARGPGLLTVVTLATPFIHARLRLTPRLGQLMLFLAAIFPVAAGLIVWDLTAISGLGRPPSGPRWASAGCAAFVSLFLSAIVLASLLAAWRYRKEFGAGFRQRLIGSVHAPTVAPGQVIAVRAAGDEATGTITVGQFIAGLSAMVTRRVFSIGGQRQFGILVMAGTLIVFYALVLSRAVTSPSVSKVTVHWAIWIVYLFLLGLSIMGGVLLLMFAAALVFGSDGPFVGLFASCSTEASPPGEAETYQLPPFAGQDGVRQGGLNHSKLYEYEPVIEHIAGLISKSANTPKAGRRAPASRTRSVRDPR